MKGMSVNIDDTEKEVVKEATKVYDFSKVPPFSGRVLKRNMPLIKGEDVKLWQNAVGGLSGDGVYGGRSEQACIKFQKEHDLKADGIVGKVTWDTTFAYQQDSQEIILKNSYWKDVAIRAVRTGVQVFAGVLMANQAGMFEADVLMAGMIAGASALVAVIQNALEDAPFDFMSKIPKG